MGPSSKTGKTADMVFRQTFKFRGDKKDIQWFPGNKCSQVYKSTILSLCPSILRSVIHYETKFQITNS